MKIYNTLNPEIKKITSFIVVFLISSIIFSTKLCAQANVLCKSASVSKNTLMSKDTVSVKKVTFETVQVIEIADDMEEAEIDSIAPSKIALEENKLMPIENINPLKLTNNEKIKSVNEKGLVNDQNTNAVQSDQNVILKKK